MLPVLLAALVLVLAMPRVSGASWSATWQVLRGVPVTALALLTAVWLAGLWVHTLALTAALPGLSPARAFFLNITGSAASNALPLGGAAGTAVNYWSCRRWGFGTGAFARWALVTNLWDNALRLALPAVAVAWLLVGGRHPSAEVAGLAMTGVVLLVGYLALAWALLHGSRSDRVLGRLLARILAGLGSAAGPARAGSIDDFRSATTRLLRVSAARSAGGKLAYALAQAWLLWLCLGAVGSGAAPVVVFSAFAVERIASLAVLTPGGSGIAEVGAVGVLAGAGLPGAEAVAAVLLYRAFVFLAEIPTGGALLAGSVLVKGRR